MASSEVVGIPVPIICGDPSLHLWYMLVYNLPRVYSGHSLRRIYLLYGSVQFIMPAVQLSTVVVCAFFLSSSSALNQHESEIIQHRDHVESIAEFSCLLPQPRLIPLHKLFFEDQLKSKAFFPDVTVLHRCNECTGSCPSGLTCGVKTSEQVALTFKATYLDDVGQHKKVNIWSAQT